MSQTDHPPTMFQAVRWLYDQTLVPTACPCGRINLIGGLILWRLDRLGHLDAARLPRLVLYGASVRRLRLAAEVISQLLDVPLRDGQVRVSRKSGQRDRDEILLVETPRTPPQNLEDDRHRYILFHGESDPRLWCPHRAQARSVLPIRVSSQVFPTYDLPEPNPIHLICDEWVRHGQPDLTDATWCWPSETTEWRTVVESVLIMAGWEFTPRTITTADDL